MVTITIHINERSKAGKALKQLLDILKDQPGIKIEANKSPYNKDFVKMVKKSAASKKRTRINNVDELWESL